MKKLFAFIAATVISAGLWATTINYTGSVHTFNVTTSGIYKLQVWGAQGGDQVLNLTEIGVAVVVEMIFKNGEKRLFAERYLPEIKVYGDDDLTYDNLYGYSFTNLPDHAPDSINGIPLGCPLYDKQKAKVNRIVRHY